MAELRACLIPPQLARSQVRSVAPLAQCPALELVDLTGAQHPTDVDVLLESGTVTVVGATP